MRESGRRGGQRGNEGEEGWDGGGQRETAPRRDGEYSRAERGPIASESCLASRSEQDMPLSRGARSAMIMHIHAPLGTMGVLMDRTALAYVAGPGQARPVLAFRFASCFRRPDVLSLPQVWPLMWNMCVPIPNLFPVLAYTAPPHSPNGTSNPVPPPTLPASHHPHPVRMYPRRRSSSWRTLRRRERRRW
jgi:hypothetical protein